MRSFVSSSPPGSSLTGFVFLLVARPVRAYRLFALAYVATFLVFALGNGKDYPAPLRARLRN